MTRYASLCLALAATLSALPPAARAQGAAQHLFEVAIETDTPIYLRVYDGDGCQLHPDIGSLSCDEDWFSYKQIVPGTGYDWTLDLGIEYDPPGCGNSCDWNLFWLGNPDIELLTFEFSDGTDIAARYVFVPSSWRDGTGTFYLPWSGLGDWDTYFEVSDASGSMVIKARGNGHATSSYEDVFAGNYVIPYDLPYFCDQIGCDATQDRSFVARVDYVPDATTRTFTLASEADARVISSWSPMWDVPNLELKFPQNRKLVVEGNLAADGVTFTEAVAGQGWGGIRFEPGSDGLIDNLSVIEHVRGPNGYDGTAIYIDGASPTIRNSIVQTSANYGTGATGIYVTGSAAFPVLDNNLIQNIKGDGIVLAGGAGARLIQNDVLNNIGHGIVASGSGTEAFLSPPFGSDPANGEFGNVIDDNDDGGVYASFSSYLTFGYYYYGGQGYHADGFNSVTNNGGVGLSAFYNGRIAAGNTTNQQRNRFFGNATNDAEAEGIGSRVWASCDWWNDTSPPFRTVETNGGIVDDAHYLLADPYVDPDAACVGFGGGLGGRPASTATAARSGDVSRGEDTAPRGLLIAAAEVIDRNPVAALALLGQVIEQAPDESLAATALAEAGYVLARADLPAPVRTSAGALLDAAVTGSRPALRAAALRALAAARQVQGNVAGALAAATALVEDAASPADVFFGHLARVYLYAEAGQEAEAWVALAEVEAREPESIEAVLARRYLEGTEGTDGAGAKGRSAPLLAGSALSTGAKVASAEAEFRLDPVYPNPTRRAGTVSFALAEAGEVRLAVYDVLGREVAVLVDGSIESGRYEAAFDGTGLPSGVYLVRLVTGPHVATQPITVLR